MGRGKKNPAGHRGGDAVDRHGARGSDGERGDIHDPEDDPLRDLRPHDEDRADPVGDEYIWPEMRDGHEEDD